VSPTVVRVIGHRGARARAPENTLASFRRALSDGADGLEFDVRSLGDGTPAVLHDATVDRTTDGRGRLARFDRAGLARLDAGTSFAPSFAGERVPLFAEVLEEFLGRTILCVEMKEVLPASSLDLLAVALAARPSAPLILASFRPEAVEDVRDRLPEVPRALILPEGAGLPSREVAGRLSLWGVSAPDRDVDARFAREAAARGLALWVWTVNDPSRAEALAALGATGIITDDPATVRARLGPPAGPPPRAEDLAR
jgi:glycerophosphoryl diester phosphodiesterase